jgi:hypothetical protein
MMEGRHDPGHYLAETIALARANFPLVVTAFLVLTGLAVASDLLGRNGSSLNLVTWPVNLVLQYQVTLAALTTRGVIGGRRRTRFWAMLGMSFLSTVGIFLAMILLLVPGLYLLVRWSLATPILVAEEAGPIQCLSRSFEETSGRFWPLAGLFLLVSVPVLLSLTSTLFQAHGITLLSALLLNAPLNLSVVAAWLAAAAVYAEGKESHALADVFA